MSVKLHTLPDAYREVLADAERRAHLAYADAINHESPTYDEAFARIHFVYTDLCEQVMVCDTYGCYERTEREQYCAEHRSHEVMGL